MLYNFHIITGPKARTKGWKMCCVRKEMFQWCLSDDTRHCTLDRSSCRDLYGHWTSFTTMLYNVWDTACYNFYMDKSVKN